MWGLVGRGTSDLWRSWNPVRGIPPKLYGRGTSGLWRDWNQDCPRVKLLRVHEGFGLVRREVSKQSYP